MNKLISYGLVLVILLGALFLVEFVIMGDFLPEKMRFENWPMGLRLLGGGIVVIYFAAVVIDLVCSFLHIYRKKPEERQTLQNSDWESWKD